MRLASFEKDYWQLRSAEESHRQHPDFFWIPPLEKRQNLLRGQAARLIFDIEAVDENGEIEVQGERMWVIVTEKAGDFFIGVLDNQPAFIEPAEDVYLCIGAQIPFLPEHVIDIVDPQKEYVEWRLSKPPERLWPRDEES